MSATSYDLSAYGIEPVERDDYIKGQEVQVFVFLWGEHLTSLGPMSLVEDGGKLTLVLRVSDPGDVARMRADGVEIRVRAILHGQDGSTGQLEWIATAGRLSIESRRDYVTITLDEAARVEWGSADSDPVITCPGPAK